MDSPNILILFILAFCIASEAFWLTHRKQGKEMDRVDKYSFNLDNDIDVDLEKLRLISKGEKDEVLVDKSGMEDIQLTERGGLQGKQQHNVNNDPTRFTLDNIELTRKTSNPLQPKRKDATYHKWSVVHQDTTHRKDHADNNKFNDRAILDLELAAQSVLPNNGRIKVERNDMIVKKITKLSDLQKKKGVLKAPFRLLDNNNVLGLYGNLISTNPSLTNRREAVEKYCWDVIAARICHRIGSSERSKVVCRNQSEQRCTDVVNKIEDS